MAVMPSDMQMFDYQQYLVDDVHDMPGPQRICLYYRTGAGKTLSALLVLQTWGYDRAVVIAPPSTHTQWIEAGRSMGIEVQPVSHAKFRMKDYRLSRSVAVVADEMHLFGGQQGQGWRKLSTTARHLEAPLILMSATPNYNDAERVYCVHSILNPTATKGGYLNWLYQNCLTEQDPFSRTPKVTGFRDYPDAAAFLADLPRVYHVPDDRQVDIEDLPYDENTPRELLEWGYDRVNHRLIASAMERRQTIRFQGLVNGLYHIRPHIMAEIMDVIDDHGTVLIFCARARVSHALSATLTKYGVGHALVTGQTGKGQKEARIDLFRTGQERILVGTSTLATGTDGLDKVCDTLLIVDDTDDDALRRQLIGRILPRGVEAPIDSKRIFRLLPNT